MADLRICIIGNSHTASFRTGWAKIRDQYQNIEVSYFVGQGQYFGDLYADTEKNQLLLKPDSAQGAFINAQEIVEEICFDRFDLCLIVGAPDWRLNINHNRYSAQVVELATLNWYGKSLAGYLVSEIRKLSDIEILMAHKPFPAGKSASKARNVGNYLKEIKFINREIAVAQNATLLAQPSSTYNESMETHWKFAVGLKVKPQTNNTLAPHRLIDDISHMKANFGKVFWAEIFERQGIEPS